MDVQQHDNVEDENLAKGEAYAGNLLPADGEKEFFLPPQRGADSGVIEKGILLRRNVSAEKGLLLPIGMVLLLEYCKSLVFDPGRSVHLLQLVQEHADGVGCLLPKNGPLLLKHADEEGGLLPPSNAAYAGCLLPMISGDHVKLQFFLIKNTKDTDKSNQQAFWNANMVDSAVVADGNFEAIKDAAWLIRIPCPRVKMKVKLLDVRHHKCFLDPGISYADSIETENIITSKLWIQIAADVNLLAASHGKEDGHVSADNSVMNSQCRTPNAADRKFPADAYVRCLRKRPAGSLEEWRINKKGLLPAAVMVECLGPPNTTETGPHDDLRQAKAAKDRKWQENVVKTAQQTASASASAPSAVNAIAGAALTMTLIVVVMLLSIMVTLVHLLRLDVFTPGRVPLPEEEARDVELESRFAAAVDDQEDQML